MARPELPPVGVSMSADVEVLDGRPKPYRARVRWIDPATGRRKSKSECVATLEAAQAWIDGLSRAARGGIDPKGTKGKAGPNGSADRGNPTNGRCSFACSEAPR
jgi:hypothetical protein